MQDEPSPTPDETLHDRTPAKGLLDAKPTAVFILCAALVLYIIVVAGLIFATWDTDYLPTENAWTRAKDAATMGGAVVTVLAGAIAGFLAQVPSKMRLEDDVRGLGKSLREIEQGSGTGLPGAAKEIMRRRRL